MARGRRRSLVRSTGSIRPRKELLHRHSGKENSKCGQNVSVNSWGLRSSSCWAMAWWLTCCLRSPRPQGAGWLAIAAGWAFAVVFGVFTAIACGSPDAALNPAVSFGLAIETGDFSKFIPFFVAQMLGAMLGALLVWLHFLPHWRETEDPGTEVSLLLNHARDSKLRGEPAQRNYRHVCAPAGCRRDLLEEGRDRRARSPASGLIWWESLCGPSACLWVAPPVMRSIRRATSAPASSIRFSRSARRLAPVGATPPCRWLVL